MKFCDKLQKIRKENNVTQEQLADKLNVSRQAVSKWESGTAYPDTEKLIAISKIFHTSLDELINDNKDPNGSTPTKKFDLLETFKIIAEFISKAINMFWSMTFRQKIKFLFEMGVLILALIIATKISKGILMSIIQRIFTFLPDNIFSWLSGIIETIIYLLCMIFGGFIFVKVLKTRYLDYYIVINDDSVDEKVMEEPIKELKEKKEYKVVIRDPSDSSSGFLKAIGKIFVFCLNVLAIFIAAPVIIMFIFFTTLLVISLGYLFSGFFFNGITLSLLGVLAFIFLILWFIYNLIFNQKNNYQRMFKVFILSLILIGVGIGVSFISFNNFEFEETAILDNKETETIKMKDNLIIHDIMNIPEDKIVITNESDIKLDILTPKYMETYIYDYYTSDGKEDYYVVRISKDVKPMTLFKKVMDDIKDEKINTYIYDGDYEIDKVYISKDNLTKIKDNYKKLYENES